MQTQPQLENRLSQPYAAIPVEVTLDEIGSRLPPLINEVLVWLAVHHIAPAGAPYFRYLVIHPNGKTKMEVGVPIAQLIAGDERIKTGVLPAGSYAVVLHQGDYKEITGATSRLLEWGAAHHIVWQIRQIDGEEVWSARLESFLNDRQMDPDPQSWQTEISILVAA